MTRYLSSAWLQVLRTFLRTAGFHPFGDVGKVTDRNVGIKGEYF